jgi:hypothetical protein
MGVTRVSTTLPETGHSCLRMAICHVPVSFQWSDKTCCQHDLLLMFTVSFTRHQHANARGLLFTEFVQDCLCTEKFYFSRTLILKMFLCSCAYGTLLFLGEQDSISSIVSRLWTGWYGVRYPVGTRGFPPFKCVQTNSEGYPVSYSVGTRDSFPGDEANCVWG